MLVSKKGAQIRASEVCTPFSFVVFLLGLFFLSAVVSVAQAFADTGEVDKLVANGASTLALSLLAQDVNNGTADDWMRQQRQRIAIYQNQASWDAVLGESEGLPTGLPGDYLQWLNTQVVLAHLGRGEAAAAQNILFSLFWSDTLEANSALFRQWRMLLVRSYLNAGRFDDAYVTALRYEQDYSDSRHEPQWAVLKARVLIAVGRGDDVRALLAGNPLPQAVLVLNTSLLDSRLPVGALKLLQVLPLLAHPQIDVDVKQGFYAALLGASKRIGELPQRIKVLEALLSIPVSKGVDVGAAADLLWQTYDELALQVSNKLQLLMGDYDAWFVAAEELGGDERSRALYAWLALNLDGEQTLPAHHKLSELLIGLDAESELLAALYLFSSRFSVDTTPVQIVFYLLDQSLNQGRLAEAISLMASLPQPKGSQALVDWQLRQARIQVLEGMPEYGAKLLEQLVKAGYSFNTRQMDAYMQAFFDLKAMAEYPLAFMLAEALLPQVPSIARHRQLLAWMGDIRAAQYRDAEAARFYLRSATLVDTLALDVYAKEAKRKAAQALARAGMVEDARNIYQALIDEEKDAELKTILTRDKQQLRPVKAFASP